jgi:uncharacterized protein (DUF1501 family)
MQRSRRQILKYAALGGGTLLLPRFEGGATGSGSAEPHFFLLLFLNGGADSAYTFDARPLSMTAAGKIQNYLGAEPIPWRGRNGVGALATSLVKPLVPFRDRFSVLNGVLMAPGFDGHQQNANFLFTGSPFGGDSFVPHFNLAETGRPRASLDAISPSDPLPLNVENHSSVVSLRPQAMGVLADTLRDRAPSPSADRLAAFMRGRLIANAEGPGRFATGTSLMLSGLDGAPDVQRKLVQLTAPKRGTSAEQQAVAMIGECFRLSIARSAIYVLPEFFDVHAEDLAKTQPKLFAEAIGKIAVVLRGLVETPYDAKRSLLDVTTVMVATEFGRTMRSADMPIDQTGTNHNPLASTILLAGKGIRGGLVVGASDLPDEKAAPSKAHLALDPDLEKAMGLPFDFATLRPRADAPEPFDLNDYLTAASVVNTLYALFGVDKSRHRSPGRNLPVAPVLRGLMS